MITRFAITGQQTSSLSSVKLKVAPYEWPL
ncbi:hypothetical protein [Shigella phage ESh12]|uniref:Uncharacterized protein n=1 Tax=Klebsiella phage Keithsmous TaxID=3098263 RepID=A0ABZ2EQ06_9CAUD|nr:hypothetical protein [Shigella phage ESh12]